MPALTAESVPTALFLAKRYCGDIEALHYWASEKLYGVRDGWDGEALQFRSGNPVPAPTWFLHALSK